MEGFVVSARKYRPQVFDEVVGQEHITTTLKNAIDNNHLAQALLFCGPRGVGKTTCARIVARMINGYEDADQDLSLNIFELDAASNNSVDHIRSLTDQIRYPPQSGKFKVYIIDEVHMLSNNAFNAFLKTLEEPPPYAVFILATTEKHKVIPTVLSRCQIYDFDRISISQIAEHLSGIAEKEGIKAEDEALHLIAKKADGALRDALSIFDLISTFSSDNSITYQSTIDNLHILDYDYYFRMTDSLLAEDITGSLLLFDEILKKGFDGHNFIVGLSEHFRNLMVCKDPESMKLLETAENARKKYEEQSNSAELSFLLSAINIASQCDIDYKTSKNQRLLVELALMKIAHIPSALQLASLPGGEDKKKTEVTSEEPVIEAEESPEPAHVEPPQVEEKAEEVIVQPPDPVKEDTISNENLKKTVKMPSLSDLKNGGYNSDTATDDIQEEAEDDKNADFTKEDVESYWKEFAEIRKQTGKSQEQNVLKQPLVIDLDTREIQIKLTNSLQLDILEEIRSDLSIFLKKSLQNTRIKLVPVLEKTENEDNLLYTNKEKLEHLGNLNPVVKDLQEKLGLDPDF